MFGSCLPDFLFTDSRIVTVEVGDVVFAKIDVGVKESI